MADLFDFKNYGTFTGPSNGNFTFDDSEPNWHKQLPTEGPEFNVTDIGILFYKNRGRYAWFHANGNDVNNIILESNVGPLGSLVANVSQTFFNGDINIDGNIFATRSVFCGGSVVCSSSLNVAGCGDVASRINKNSALAGSKKSFDIPHPTKENHRLRYVCLEGPEAEVYYRGKLKDSTVIKLPDYWNELVNVNTIGVSLTPIGCYQELFVEKIEGSQNIIVKNRSGDAINCSYVVYGERKDVSKNISEYQGLTEDDYPGDNDQYIVNSD
jgi:hypothetical protein